MPLILAIESSTARGSVALIDEQHCLFTQSFISARSHNSALFAPLSEALEKAGGQPISLVLAGTGPGSYSGTRVGIAAAQGVAIVHGCPAVGVSSLLAAGFEQGVAVGDARRGSFWFAEMGSTIPSPELCLAEDLATRTAGKGVVFTFEDPTRFNDLPTAPQRAHPDALRLVKGWLQLRRDAQTSLLTTTPQPVYLRPPHVTQAKLGHPLRR